MSILLHPEWPVLRPFVRVGRYARDTGPRGARVRLDVERPTDGRVMRRLQAIQMPCVTCGAPIQAVRERSGRRYGGLFYYCPTCPQDVSVRCSRNPKASREVTAVREAVEAWQANGAPPPAQGNLFGGPR